MVGYQPWFNSNKKNQMVPTDFVFMSMFHAEKWLEQKLVEDGYRDWELREVFVFEGAIPVNLEEQRQILTALKKLTKEEKRLLGLEK